MRQIERTMTRSPYRIDTGTAAFTAVVIGILLAGLCSESLYAQSSFRLKRTKNESIPITAQVYAGYNGMSDPADKL